jgi:hypothetical protein
MIAECAHVRSGARQTVPTTSHRAARRQPAARGEQQ